VRRPSGAFAGTSRFQSGSGLPQSKTIRLFNPVGDDVRSLILNKPQSAIANPELKYAAPMGLTIKPARANCLLPKIKFKR